MDVRLLFLFSYWKEGFTSVIFLPLYFSFKFSIRSLPSFEDLPFSAPTLGEEDFIHLSAVLLLIKPYIKKLKVKVLLGNSFFICIITCCKRKSKERNWRKCIHISYSSLAASLTFKIKAMFDHGLGLVPTVEPWAVYLLWGFPPAGVSMSPLLGNLTRDGLPMRMSFLWGSLSYDTHTH